MAQKGSANLTLSVMINTEIRATCFNYTGRVSVRRERLNQGGYTRDGVYFGVGEPLYYIQDADGHYGDYYRATDRGDAVEIARRCYPKAKIRP